MKFEVSFNLGALLGALSKIWGPSSLFGAPPYTRGILGALLGALLFIWGLSRSFGGPPLYLEAPPYSKGILEALS